MCNNPLPDGVEIVVLGSYFGGYKIFPFSNSDVNQDAFIYIGYNGEIVEPNISKNLKRQINYVLSLGRAKTISRSMELVQQHRVTALIVQLCCLFLVCLLISIAVGY